MQSVLFYFNLPREKEYMALREIREGSGEACSERRRAQQMRALFSEEGIASCIYVLEKNGVLSLEDLKRVKYSDLSRFGVVEFEPRRKIFELIKRLNAEDAGAEAHSSGTSHFARTNTPLAKTRTREPGRSVSDLSFSFTAKDQELFRRRLEAESNRHAEGRDACQDRQPVPREARGPGVSPNTSLSEMKKKKKMVMELIDEAEDSLSSLSIPDIEGSTKHVESTHLSATRSSMALSVTDETVLAETTGEHTSLSAEESDTKGSMEGLFPKEGSTEERKRTSSEKITVVVRKRPLKRGIPEEEDVVDIVGSAVLLHDHRQRMDLTPYVETHTFSFDMAFGEEHTTEDLYGSCTRGLILHALQGGLATCITYGQTGSGKTYTMLNEANGVMLIGLKEILRTSRIRVSFYEIYANNLFDLLNGHKRIHARENEGKVEMIGLSEHAVETIQDAVRILRRGLEGRTTGKTGANNMSSRSHAIFRIRLEMGGGAMTFVDLAGSERGRERADDGLELKREGAEINKSLLALKECIRAMDRSAAHLPFRHSRLTQVLKESLVGNAKCCVIATISPEKASSEHTLNTLRYAFRIKEVNRKGRPVSEDRGSGAVHGREEGEASWLSNASEQTARQAGGKSRQGSSRDLPAPDSPFLLNGGPSRTSRTGPSGGPRETRRGNEEFDKAQVFTALAAISRLVFKEGDKKKLLAVLSTLSSIESFLAKK